MKKKTPQHIHNKSTVLIQKLDYKSEPYNTAK